VNRFHKGGEVNGIDYVFEIETINSLIEIITINHSLSTIQQQIPLCKQLFTDIRPLQS
jgi:hypothetical protein